MGRALTCLSFSRPFAGTQLAGKPRFALQRRRSCVKWVVRADMEQNWGKTKVVDMEGMVKFLYDDLPHIFDDQGIDRRAYDERIKYSDPITKHTSISGYLFNIAMLKFLFNPDFELHWVKQTGPYEISTRWSITMRSVLLPWKPELVFTGTSVMGVNPHTGRFCTQQDYWDPIKNNDYFSAEGLFYVLEQLMTYKKSNLGSPKFKILKRTADYEIRKYTTLVTTEAKGDEPAGLNSVAGMQASNEDMVNLMGAGGGVAAVLMFSEKPTEDIVREKEKALRRSLLRDGLRPRGGHLNFIMRNEVLIWLEDFSLGSNIAVEEVKNPVYVKG